MLAYHAYRNFLKYLVVHILELQLYFLPKGFWRSEPQVVLINVLVHLLRWPVKEKNAVFRHKHVYNEVRSLIWEVMYFFHLTILRNNVKMI